MIPSLVGIIVFYVSLIAYSEYQAKNAYDRFYSSSSRSLAFTNKLLSTSLGFSSDKLFGPGQKSKGLIASNCFRGIFNVSRFKASFMHFITSSSILLNWKWHAVRDKLRKSSGLYLGLYLVIDSVDKDVRQIRLLTYVGGTLLVFGALASAAFYSSRKALNQQIQTDRLIDEIIASSPNHTLLSIRILRLHLFLTLCDLLQDPSSFKSFSSLKDNCLFNWLPCFLLNRQSVFFLFCVN